MSSVIFSQQWDYATTSSDRARLLNEPHACSRHQTPPQPCPICVCGVEYAYTLHCDVHTHVDISKNRQRTAFHGPVLRVIASPETAVEQHFTILRDAHYVILPLTLPTITGRAPWALHVPTGTVSPILYDSVLSDDAHPSSRAMHLASNALKYMQPLFGVFPVLEKMVTRVVIVYCRALPGHPEELCVGHVFLV
jgi:hypothetical protein